VFLPGSEYLLIEGVSPEGMATEIGLAPQRGRDRGSAGDTSREHRERRLPATVGPCRLRALSAGHGRSRRANVSITPRQVQLVGVDDMDLQLTSGLGATRKGPHNTSPRRRGGAGERCRGASLQPLLYLTFFGIVAAYLLPADGPKIWNSGSGQ
jgi:hypothetical protein